MSLRDPLISKAVQIAFAVMSALWLINFALQDTHTTLRLGIATSECPGPHWTTGISRQIIFRSTRSLGHHPTRPTCKPAAQDRSCTGVKSNSQYRSRKNWQYQRQRQVHYNY